MTKPDIAAAPQRSTGAVPNGKVDPRAPRFAASITAVLLLVGVFVTLLGSSASATLGALSPLQRAVDPGSLLLALIAALFAWSLISPKSQPWSVVFRLLVRPKLGAPAEWEDARPPRFAQGVGLVVVGAGLLLHIVGVPWALVIAAVAAFAAAALNATIGFCLGCEIYLLLLRIGVIRVADASAVSTTGR